MNIHEYQAKELFLKFGVPTPAGAVASTKEEAAKAAKATHASLYKNRAALDKAHAANLKELEKNYKAAVATATKTYAATAKESDKALKAAAIALTKADADVLKLVPTVAPTTKLAATADAVSEKAVPTETA